MEMINNSTFDSSNDGERWDKPPVPSLPEPLPKPVLPVPNENGLGFRTTVSSGGKPTVQVHPMCLNENGTLTVNVESELRKESPSPRPPVPKKPVFLSSPLRTPPVFVDSPRRQEQLSSLEDKCSRLSQFVSQNDDSLANILQPGLYVPETSNGVESIPEETTEEVLFQR